MSRDEFFNVLALALILLPFIDWTAVLIVLRAFHRRPDLASLKDRLLVAFGIAALSTLFAVLALSRLEQITLPNDIVGVVLTTIVLFLSLVNLAFIRRYWRAAW